MTEYLTKVTAGKIQRNIARQIAKDLPQFDGKKVFIRITPINTRSYAQNSYLHAMFGIFAKSLVDLTGDTDWSKELVKDMCKAKFLTADIVNKDTGEVIGQYVRATRTLNKDEFGDFTRSVIGYAQDKFGIHLPLPGEVTEMEI